MRTASILARKLSARKRPSQPRSEKMVARILDATRRLLMKPGAKQYASITTNHIAKEADISIGSLYQYFPNKEAILFEIYKDMLKQVSSVLQEFRTKDSLSLAREEFFNLFVRAMKSAEANPKLTMEMLAAMTNYPLLAEADRHHSELIANEMAGFMKHFGSKWPLAKLQRLALHVYYVNYGTWIYREHVSPPPREVLEWEINMLTSMIAQCFKSGQRNG
jgi:AcrR family transcriptional regulator